MKDLVIKHLPDNERKALVEELSNRLKDLVYMFAYTVAEEKIGELSKISLKARDSIAFCFTVELVGADLMQIIGRLRR